MRFTSYISFGFLVAAFCSNSVMGAVPSEKFLPTTTKSFVSIPDPDVTRAAFEKIQFGELMNDPIMKEFNDSLEKQLEGKGRLAERLGISLNDLDGVYRGEITMAMIQPGGNRDAFATALIVNVRTDDKGKAALDMLTKIQKRRLAAYKGSTAVSHKFGRTSGVVVKVPASRGQPAINTYYFFSGAIFVAVDHLQEAEAIYNRIVTGTGTSLADVVAFKQVNAEVAAQSKDAAVHVRWFIEPFGLNRVRQAERHVREGTTRRRGRDMLAVYEREGFDAVQGMGGRITFDANPYQVLHRSMVYAPAVDRTKKDEETAKRLATEAKAGDAQLPYKGPANTKYFLGARMMQFPNSAPLTPLAWIPSELATYVTFNWPLQRAFQYSETLSNAISDDPKQQVWGEVLDSIAKDPDGPKVDLRKNFIMQLGDRMTIITDNVEPITTKSEETAMIFEITGDPELAYATLNKMMADDPDAIKHEVGGRIVWELITQDKVNPMEGGAADDEEEFEEEEERLLPNSILTVAHGCLIRGTHMNIVKRIMATPAPADALANAPDYKAVIAELDQLTDKNESFRSFDRLDRSVKVNWMLWKAGQMPEAETAVGNMINRMLGFDPDESETARDQQIDASTLPDFDKVKKYFGPSGFFVKTVNDGWFVTGVILKK